MLTSESRLLSCLGIECGTRCQMCDNGKPEAVCERQGLPLDVLVQDARCVTTGVLVAQNLEQLLVVSVGAVASKSSQHMGMYPYMLGPPSIRDFAVHTWAPQYMGVHFPRLRQHVIIAFNRTSSDCGPDLCGHLLLVHDKRLALMWFLGERMSDIFQFDLIEHDTLDGYRVISSDLRGRCIGYTMPLL